MSLQLYSTYEQAVNGFAIGNFAVVAAHVGAMNFWKLAISGSEPLYVRYCIRVFELFEEYTHYLRETTGHHNLSQVTVFYDLSGFSAKQSACLQCQYNNRSSLINRE